MTWNIAVPADTDPIRQGASAIRSIEADLQTALTAEGVFPGANTSAPVFRWKPRVGNQASRPANDPVNSGTTYYNTDLNEWELDTGTVWIVLASSTPSGIILAFGGTIIPVGYLTCDGSAVSRTTYANLFAAIGIAHGSGDGSTTFNIPDYRGQFLRGVDTGAGRDPDSGSRTSMNSGGNAGDAVGSVQAGATAKNGLAVTIVDPSHQHSNGATDSGVGAGSGGSGFHLTNFTSTGISPTGITATIAGDHETRPTNAYVNWIIKT